MLNNDEHYLWVERFRPSTIDECILPTELKETFQSYVNAGTVSNLLLTGPAGSGKTTVARAMLEQLGCDYMIINGSLNGNIDTLRNEIQQYASSVSLMGGRKYVILDEADHLNPNSVQPSLRNFMEQYSKNTGFILTCNFPNKIMEPLRSRCSVIDFKIAKKDLPALAGQFLKRCIHILETNNIEYDKAAVVGVIKKFYPDWRRVLNELQRYSITGKIDSGILTSLTEVNLKTLMKHLKERDFTNARKWVAENSDSDSVAMFRNLYDTAHEYVDKKSIPALVMVLAKYQYQDAFVADKEINIMSCLTEIMIECEWL